MSWSRSRWSVRSQQPVAYDVMTTPTLFDLPDTTLLRAGGGSGNRRFVVLDDNVARSHGGRIRRWFDHHALEAHIEIFRSGESHKTFEAYTQVLHALEAFPIHRRDEPIIAIGGGVLTDVVGFVAATYRRGIPHINVPTTLMGYVDAGIGIKTAVNFGPSKNRIGSFTPPAAVLLDPAFLRTLPRRDLLNGVCEILKLAVIRDATLFRWLEQDGATSIATGFADPGGAAILDRAISGMLEELAPNLFEMDLARSVDFGHTFSNGLEANPRYDLLHGEAVLLDILVSLMLAQRRGLLRSNDVAQVCELVQRLGLHPALPALDAAAMWQTLQDRIQHRNGHQRVPLPAGIGRCVFVDDITFPELEASLTGLRAHVETPHALILER